MDNESPNNETPINSQMGRTHWTPPMDRCFIDLMVEQVLGGKYQDGQFSQVAWKHIVSTFNAKFGTQYKREIMRNRQKTLKKNYNVIKSLLDLSGFGWNPARQMVEAEDSVWDDYIKAHPEARTWRTRSVSCFNELCIVFGDSSATGRYSNGSLDTNVNQTDVGQNREDFEGVQSPNTFFGTENSVDQPQETMRGGEDVDTPNQQKRRQPAVPSTSQVPKKGRKSTGESMVDAIQGMAAAVTYLANKRSENKSYSSEELYVALKEISDLDTPLFLDSLELLEDQQKAKFFMELGDVEAKKQWLMRKIQKN